MPQSSHEWVALGLWILGSFTAGVAGSIASVGAPKFYAQLSKPRWAPPVWLFGPVWTVLYLLMGTAAWMVWRVGGWQSPTRAALILFVVQLALNGLWSWLFFVGRRGGLALAEIAVLWLVVATMATLFARAEPLAGMLLVPYLIWLSLALALTRSVWRRNPSLL